MIFFGVDFLGFVSYLRKFREKPEDSRFVLVFLVLFCIFYMFLLLLTVFLVGDLQGWEHKL